ncbi:SDR family oxidoreductase [Roseitalea porphyridii]|uniref:SDR family oxidoreductase n=1 Tax=Roseitalea porphyridii TaxID=1852022 RepID=A0A4P6UZ55_9HYPH|nr:SDR family oxidoreductase [Roseitalea porphyridii]QBK30322.1 SDR family oxidoreductase [Roseitalea porphyridii]
MAHFFITGAARGIGRALASQALQRGRAVTVSVRAASDLSKVPDGVEAVVFDVRDDAAVATVAAGIDRPVDVLVNNAGVIGPARQSTLDMDFDGFAETLAINTLAPLRVSQAFLPLLRRSDRPRIVTISSAMGRLSYQKSDRIAYRASKAAVNKVMQGLATDLRSEGIAVQCVHPGWVRTDMGGPQADIDVAESAGGILDRAEALELVDTGSFVNYDGSTIDW